MRCRGRCFSTIGGSHRVPVVHDEPGQNGVTWYFCPAHRPFHAFFLFPNAPQPLCGECAVMFFDRSHHAVWIRQYDLDAVMSNSFEVHQQARADIESLLQHSGNPNPQGNGNDPLGPPLDITPNFLDDIPKDDTTYTSLKTNLIPHKRIKGLHLLEYRTFHGAAAYQPCSRNIDLLSIFDSLIPIDQGGDPIFKQARTWSCIVQSMQDLPKELRWVLATMYNFCNEMLRHEIKEPELWRKRPWLMHWYSVAEHILDTLGITATTPEVDWFERPSTVRRAWTRQGRVANPGHNLRQDTSDGSSGGKETVIRRQPRSSDPRPSRTRRSPQRNGVASVLEWLHEQPDFLELDETELFDPTPGGYVSPRGSNSRSPKSSSPLKSHEASNTPKSRLDPRAATFKPRKKRKLKPGWAERCQDDDSSATSGEDEGSQTGTSACSCLSPNNSSCLTAGHGQPNRRSDIEGGEDADESRARLIFD